MGLRDFLRDIDEANRAVRGLGYAKVSGPPRAQWLQATAEAQRFSVPEASLYTNQANLFRTLSWVNIAVMLHAQTAASVALNVKKIEGEERVDIPNHPFELRLQRPNEMQSRQEFLEATFAFRALTGNAYWWLNAAGEGQEPDELWIIEPNHIKPVPDGKLYLKGYLYDPGDGREIALKPWEVVHFKRFHPLNRYVGLSPVEAVIITATSDLEMQKYNARFFGESNGKLASVLAFADPIEDNEWEVLKREARERSQKRDMMMLRNVGKGGVEWIRAAATQKDMEFLAGRDFNKEEIFDIFAPGALSFLSDNATEANATVGERIFIEKNVWPALTAVGEKVSLSIMPLYDGKKAGETSSLVAEFEDIRMANREDDLAEQAEYSKTHTVDEIRAEYYGDNPLGDERGEKLPAEIAATQSAPPSFGAPDMGVEEPVETEVEPEYESLDKMDEWKELDSWERFAQKRLGKTARPFKCQAIGAERKARIEAGLKSAKTASEIKAVFDAERKTRPSIQGLTEALLETARALRETA